MVDHSPSGRGSTRVAESPGHLTEGIELGAAAGARIEVCLQLGELLAVDGVEGVGAEELAGIVVGHHASAPRTPASESARRARIRRMPLRIRLFTVPSG